MYRATRPFEKQGFEVIAYKVDYKATRSLKTTIMDFLPDSQSLRLTETGIREIIGRLFYIIKN